MIQLNESNFTEGISDGVVVVDFSAPWCGPCRALEPILEQLTGAKICKINVDDSPGLASQFNVSAVPTLVFFKNGIKVDTTLGIQSKEAMQRKIDEANGELRTKTG